ncbi:MAG: hypothetical protein PUG70_08535 [Lachnospiraceae bacterium]|nr:hypothetical protein [Lachnospiraceae bacterium]MDY5521499.1 hypothetical protein [Agathobacter sp.]
MKYVLLLSKEVASAASFAYIKAAMGLRERNCLTDPRGAGIGRKREPGRPSKQFAVGLRAEKCLRDPRRAVVQGKIRRKEVCRGSQKKKKSERPRESCSPREKQKKRSPPWVSEKENA